MIDTQADDGAWAEALAAPCSFRTISDFNPEPDLGSHGAMSPNLTGALGSPLPCGRSGHFSIHLHEDAQ